MEPKENRPSAEKTKISPNWMLGLVCLPIFIGALDLTVISAVLPPVLGDLKLPLQDSLNDAAWMVTGYLLAYTVSMTFMGRVSDLWGRRRVYIICLVIFIIGSAWVAAAPDTLARLINQGMMRMGLTGVSLSYLRLYLIIIGRVIQAFGAGALVPVSMALVGDLYGREKRATALGVIGAVDTAGWVLGHVYGGIMVQYFHWTMIFWINIPLAGGALIITAWALRQQAHTLIKSRFDWVGAILIAFSLTALNLGLGSGFEPSTELSSGQSATPVSLVWLGAAGLALIGFIWHELRFPHPLMVLFHFRKRLYTSANLVNLISGFCIMAGLVSVPLYINTIPTVLYGLPFDRAALLAGYLLSGFTIPMALAAPIGGWMVARWGYRIPTSLGMGFAALGFFLISQWTSEQSAPVVESLAYGWGFLMNTDLLIGTLEMSAGLIIAGIGLGLAIAPITSAVVNTAGSEERGSASALVIILRLIGMSVGTSALTTYGLTRSQNLLSTALEDVAFTDFARQLQALVDSTAQVIEEIAWIAALAAAIGLLITFLMQSGISSDRK